MKSYLYFSTILVSTSLCTGPSGCSERVGIDELSSSSSHLHVDSTHVSGFQLNRSARCLSRGGIHEYHKGKRAAGSHVLVDSSRSFHRKTILQAGEDCQGQIGKVGSRGHRDHSPLLSGFTGEYYQVASGVSHP